MFFQFDFNFYYHYTFESLGCEGRKAILRYEKSKCKYCQILNLLGNCEAFMVSLSGLVVEWFGSLGINC